MRYNLGRATDRDTFKSKVPAIAYENLLPDIQRIANGDHSPILYGHLISEFLTRYELAKTKVGQGMSLFVVLRLAVVASCLPSCTGHDFPSYKAPMSSFRTYFLSSRTMASIPLKYPYPSNLNITNFVSLKLKSTNYLLWETQVLSLIESQDLLGFITGKTTQPEAEINDDNSEKIMNPYLLAWVRTDRLVKAWIIAIISEEALGTVVGITTSNDVWNALANAYSQNSQAREFELLFKLQEKKRIRLHFMCI
ncbi:hypothetical protein GIB67_020218 [Kingdonia uniflora]|uniref:Retrotransposon Copia-like N-terminal domain-containing protein n=1 Tax=Kingdonia uniflora TaxID=39325 RepID=A0A7J7P3K5_9MAGN|nr:hypothetical protein GIB67_020218 [Kingdonia uniflora]